MKTSLYKDQVVWIIGASSGIGAALAAKLSDSQAVLALSARRQEELTALRDQLGDRHKIFTLDISDAEKTLRTAQAIRAAFGRIDRVIYLAALYAPMHLDHLDMAVTKSIIDINLLGAFHLIHAVLPILKAQKNPSQLALCGSVAGYTGLPGGQPYSATKAAIINLAESLASECRGSIDIKLINPGFVRTALTDKNAFAMPMIIDAEQAAEHIAAGLLSRRFEIHFPKRFTRLLKILRTLPYALSLRLTRKIQA